MLHLETTLENLMLLLSKVHIDCSEKFGSTLENPSLLLAKVDNFLSP